MAYKIIKVKSYGKNIYLEKVVSGGRKGDYLLRKGKKPLFLFNLKAYKDEKNIKQSATKYIKKYT